MVKKYLFFIFIFVFFVACSSTTVNSLNSNNFILGKKNAPIKIDFTNAIHKNYSSYCTNMSSTIIDENDEYGYLFIESIDVSNLCEWSGLPSSFFEGSIKESLKINFIQSVEEFDMEGFSFKTLKINNDSYLSLIYIYSSFQDILIYDLNGKLSSELLKSFKSNYKSEFLDKKRFDKRYKDSLVRKSFMNNYFDEIESERLK